MIKNSTFFRDIILVITIEENYKTKKSKFIKNK